MDFHFILKIRLSFDGIFCLLKVLKTKELLTPVCDIHLVSWLFAMLLFGSRLWQLDPDLLELHIGAAGLNMNAKLRLKLGLNHQAGMKRAFLQTSGGFAASAWLNIRRRVCKSEVGTCGPMNYLIQPAIISPEAKWRGLSTWLVSFLSAKSDCVLLVLQLITLFRDRVYLNEAMGSEASRLSFAGQYLSGDASLLISDLLLTDSGEYSCKVKSGGKIIWNRVNLTVLGEHRQNLIQQEI